jgi:hypothetical protein
MAEPEGQTGSIVHCAGDQAAAMLQLGWGESVDD